MKNWCAPIQTPLLEEKLELLLTKNNPTYGTVFRYAIVTGQNFEDILNTKVEFIRGKDSVIIENFSAAYKSYKVCLDEKTRLLINQLCEKKAADDFAFCGLDPTRPLPRTSFQRALTVATQSLGLTNITPYSLRKTHLLHIYKEYGIEQVMRLAGYTTSTRAYEFLRFTPERAAHAKEQLLSDKQTILSEIRDQLAFLEKEMYNPLNPDAFFTEVYADLITIKETLNRYSDYTKNHI